MSRYYIATHDSNEPIVLNKRNWRFYIGNSRQGFKYLNEIKPKKYKQQTDLEFAFLYFCRMVNPRARGISCVEKRLMNDQLEICRSVWLTGSNPFKLIINRQLPLQVKKDLIECIKKHKIGFKED